MPAGIPPAGVDSQVSHMLKDPQVQRTVRQILIDSGFTDKHYASSIFEGSKCMKTVGLVVHKFNEEGSLSDAGENSKSFVDVPDWATRRHYLQMGSKGLGHEREIEEQKPFQFNMRINIIQDPKDREADAEEVVDVNAYDGPKRFDLMSDD